MSSTVELAQLGLTETDLEQLLVRYAPALYLHPQESFFPCSVEWYLSRCYATRLRNNRPTGPVLISRGQVTTEALLALQLAQQPGQDPISLWMEEADWRGQPATELQNVPVYAHVKVVQSQDTQEYEALEINYITVYAYNGPYDLFGLPLIKVGSHVGDIEHVTVRLSLQRPTAGNFSNGPCDIFLAGVWFNSHRAREGEWRDAGSLAFDSYTGRIAAYVALHGHGTYPKAGKVLRIYGAANDRNSGQGIVWRPARVAHLTTEGVTSPPTLLVAPSRGASIPTPTGPSDKPPLPWQPQPDAMVQLVASSGTQAGQDWMSPEVTPALAPSSISTRFSAASAPTGLRLRPIAGSAGNGVFSSTTPLSIPAVVLPTPPVHLGSTPASPTGGLMSVGKDRAPWYQAVVERQSPPWLLYTGLFGTAESFTAQGWWAKAAPPVSRTFFQRWCLPCASEVQTLNST